ncbi:MAG: PAS domain-containing sensor histidine kinase [Burkholderiales bacterium]|nr:PAS domain-containing sensor histidine kinase [Burkholderiales bacterium]
MSAGLLALTQAALLDHLDRDDPVHALRRLVADVAQHLERPCGLVALWPDGRRRWSTGVLPDEAVSPAALLQGRHDPFIEAGCCWLPLWRLGEPLGAWLLPEHAGAAPAEQAQTLQPVLATAAALLLRERGQADPRRGGSHGELIRAALRGAGTFVWEWDIVSDRLGGINQGLELLGHDTVDGGGTQRDWDALVHPDDRAARHAAYRRHAQGDAAVYESVYRVRAADGQWRWLEERGRIIERDALGQPLRAVGTRTDVSQRRAAQAAAADATVRLSALAAQVPGMLFQYRRAVGDLGSFPYVNERCLALVGETAQALLDDASRFFRRVDFADRGPLLDSVAASERTREPWQYRFRLHHADGSLRWLRGAATPLVEPGGGLLWHGYVEDVTEAMTIEQLQQQRAAAEAANRAKTEFLSRMSHELRTPLNAVLGFAQLMEVDSTQPLSDSQRRRVGLIRESGDHLLAMINDLLDLTSIEAGRVTLVPEPLALEALVEDCLTMVRAGAQRDDVALLHAVTPGLALVADRKRMRQVLLNLLSNAIKYNRPGGQVQVAARREQDLLVLEVSDTGIGLTEGEIDQLFQPFNRLSQARSGIEGTGIGLAVTQALVTLMGGRIQVCSTPGRGSTFTIHLPQGA